MIRPNHKPLPQSRWLLCLAACFLFNVPFPPADASSSAPATVPQIHPSGRIVLPPPPDGMVDRIARRHPNGLASAPPEVEARVAALRALREDAEAAFQAGNEAAGWQLVRDQFDKPDEPDTSERAAVHFLMQMAHMARRSGDAVQATTITEVARIRIEERLRDPGMRSDRLEARSDRADWILVLGQVHQRLLDDPSSAALLFDEARRLDPASREGTWALERLASTQGRTGHSAYEPIIPDLQNVPDRVREILEDYDDE